MLEQKETRFKDAVVHLDLAKLLIVGEIMDLTQAAAHENIFSGIECDGASILRSKSVGNVPLNFPHFCIKTD